MSEAAAMFLTLLVCLAFEGHSVYGANCNDMHVYCAEWARNGECTKNPSYMLGSCKKSCGECGSSGLSMSTVIPSRSTVIPKTQPEVEFTANTLTVMPNITKDLTLRCSAHPNNEASNVHFHRVFLITVRRNSEIIASVTIDHPPAAHVGGIRSDLKVTGIVEYHSGSTKDVKSFLQLEWSSPGEETAGEYMCEVIVMEEGATVRRLDLESSLQIRVKTLAETVTYLAAEQQKLKIMTADLKNENVDLKSENVDLKSEMVEGNRNLKSIVKGEVVDLKKELERKTHIESGLVSIPRRMGKSTPHTTVTMRQNFTKAYNSRPKVTTALEQISKGAAMYSDYSITVDKIDLYGFNVTVTINRNSFTLRQLTLTWTSFPQ